VFWHPYHPPCLRPWRRWPTSRKFTFGMQEHLQGIVYGHRVKVKVKVTDVKCASSTPMREWLQLQWRQTNFSHLGDDNAPYWGRGETVAYRRIGLACGVRSLNIADPQPAGRVCGLHISDAQTDPCNDRACIVTISVCARTGANNWPRSSTKSDCQSIFARSASAVIPIEKYSINAYKKSTTSYAQKMNSVHCP